MKSRTRSRSSHLQSFLGGKRRAGVLAVVLLAAPAWPVYDALAAQSPVGLGTASSFAVLAGAGVTNTGPSVLNGNLGASPTPSITGFPPGTVNGATHAADAVANQAEADLTTAYNDAAGRSPANTVSGDLGGLTLTPGVYQSGTSLGLTGTLTLDAQGDPNAVFVFQVGSALTTASASDIDLIDGAQACNVYWQIGSSATLGTTSAFDGNILAHNSITVTNGVTVQGRVLARVGAVTLDHDTITPDPCATPPTTTTTGSGSTSTGTPGAGTSTGTGTTPVGSTPAMGDPNTSNKGAAVLTTSPRSVGATIAKYGVATCVRGKFAVSVVGRSIRTVAFSLGKEALVTSRGAGFRATIAAVGGVRVITARVSYEDGAHTTLVRLRFRACVAKAVGSPHPTGPVIPGGFTG